MLAKIQAAQACIGQRATVPELAPLPAEYHALSPADQAAADLTRRRIQIAELPPGTIPGHIIND